MKAQASRLADRLTRKRQRQIHVWVSEVEYARLKSEAEARDLSVSSLVRELCRFSTLAATTPLSGVTSHLLQFAPHKSSVHTK